MPLLGGLLADRALGFRRSVHRRRRADAARPPRARRSRRCPSSTPAWCCSRCGSGLLKPNISTIVGNSVSRSAGAARRRLQHLLHGHQYRRASSRRSASRGCAPRVRLERRLRVGRRSRMLVSADSCSSSAAGTSATPPNGCRRSRARGGSRSTPEDARSPRASTLLVVFVDLGGVLAGVLPGRVFTPDSLGRATTPLTLARAGRSSARSSRSASIVLLVRRSVVRLGMAARRGERRTVDADEDAVRHRSSGSPRSRLDGYRRHPRRRHRRACRRRGWSMPTSDRARRSLPEPDGAVARQPLAPPRSRGVMMGGWFVSLAVGGYSAGMLGALLGRCRTASSSCWSWHPAWPLRCCSLS